MFGKEINNKLHAELELDHKSYALNDQNIILIFCFAKQDQLNKNRFITEWHSMNLAIYKKQTFTGVLYTRI